MRPLRYLTATMQTLGISCVDLREVLKMSSPVNNLERECGSLKSHEIDDYYREFCRERCKVTAEAYTKGKMEIVDLDKDVPILHTYAGRLVNVGRFIVIHTNPLQDCIDNEAILKYVNNVVERAGNYEISWKVLGHKSTVKLEKILLKSGFVSEEQSKIMYLNFSEKPLHKIQSNLYVRHVKNRAGLEDFAAIHKQRSNSVSSFFLGYDMNSRPVKEDQIKFYVGYDTDIPVTCTQIIIGSEGNVGIHSLATHPDHQKKGHATVLLSKIIAELGATNCKYAFLGATCPSVDIYHRLGFRNHGHYTSFVRQGT